MVLFVSWWRSKKRKVVSVVGRIRFVWRCIVWNSFVVLGCVVR